MKQAWVLRVELSRFFDKQKAKARKMSDTELADYKNVPVMRARVEKGPLKDRILFAVYESFLKEEFTASEIGKMLQEGFLERQQIGLPNGTLRTIYCYTEKECEYQPSLRKRLFTKAVRWLENKGIVNRE